MSDRPIPFSAPMVAALLAGTKTQTRRILKPLPNRTIFFDAQKAGLNQHQSPRFASGDRLWVKETWRPFPIDLAPWDIEVAYAADGERRIIKDGEFGDNDWTMPKAAKHGNVSPLFMPRWASRLTLTVTDVRVERLQDISEEDAVAEGITEYPCLGPHRGEKATFWSAGDGTTDEGAALSSRLAYANLWDSINGPGAWDANPWVVAYTFTVHRGNIDQIGGAE